jgi:hypothetical protein
MGGAVLPLGTTKPGRLLEFCAAPVFINVDKNPTKEMVRIREIFKNLECKKGTVLSSVVVALYYCKQQKEIAQQLALSKSMKLRRY